jgi:hypothetical protein
MLVEKETVVQKKKQKQAQEEKDYHFIGPVNVLLVTNKNGIKYRERLRKHGVNAEWMDPYEKSFVHIRNRSNSYDVVLLLEDAMPHEARQLIDEFKKIPDKVQTMWEAKADDVVARVRYVALKKGLLSNGVKLA